MKIIFSGGGTLGPVIPLLAVREAILKKYPDCRFVWVGTKNGPERAIIEQVGVPWFEIGAGKWRRYVSLWNIIDVIKVIVAFFQSLILLWQEKPGLLISAGGFVSVPLHWAGALLGIPMWLHQQDARVGLANRLMFPFASKITTALRDTAESLGSDKAEWIGNPSRDLTAGAIESARERWKIPPGAPVIFALGGGTGSATINRLVLEALSHWPLEWHVIHLVGRERPRALNQGAAKAFPNYHVADFFTTEMKDAYAIADVVIARAGFATLTELAALRKAGVIIPMFGTHQEDNAKIFAEHGGIVLVDKGKSNGIALAHIVKDLVRAAELRKQLGERLHELLPRASQERIVAILDELVGSGF